MSQESRFPKREAPSFSVSPPVCDDRMNSVQILNNNAQPTTKQIDEQSQWALKQLEFKPDKLFQNSMRPVFSCVRPIVCHSSNAPFYAQCSTRRQGYCQWCNDLRQGSQQTGSQCPECGERLTAPFYRFYPGLLRIEPEKRDIKTYQRYKALFEKFGISWQTEKECNERVSQFLLIKVFAESPQFPIESFLVERAFMIGVYAGRKFETQKLGRHFLRTSLRLSSYRLQFPQEFTREMTVKNQLSESLNLRFFNGRQRFYAHCHSFNIEVWYCPRIANKADIQAEFDRLCGISSSSKVTAAASSSSASLSAATAGTANTTGVTVNGIPAGSIAPASLLIASTPQRRSSVTLSTMTTQTGESLLSPDPLWTDPFLQSVTTPIFSNLTTPLSNLSAASHPFKFDEFLPVLSQFNSAANALTPSTQASVAAAAVALATPKSNNVPIPAMLPAVTKTTVNTVKPAENSAVAADVVAPAPAAPAIVVADPLPGKQQTVVEDSKEEEK